jgi:predicted lipoprotein with Yx(FWY)xxD motif
MTRTRLVNLLAGSALVALTALAAGCGGSGGGATAATPTPKATIGVASSGLGTILVDSQGRTLYLFKADRGTTSACSGACAAAWPPLLSTGKPTAASGANASLVGSAKRSDGTTQVTYAGHPLYRFTQDEKPGETNGEGLNAFGAAWFALSPAGSQVAKQSSSGAAAPQPAKPAAPKAAAPKPAAPKAAAPMPAPEAVAPKPAPERTAPPAPKPPAETAPKQEAPPSNGIPQNGGGDGDSDNNGGPSDGDGNV